MIKFILSLLILTQVVQINAQSDSLEMKVADRAKATEMYKMGQQDAKRYYKGYKGAGTGVVLTGTVLTPVVGVIPAAFTSGSKVKEQNLSYPDKILFANKDYRDGYIDKANGRKKSRVWMNWGISWLSFAIVYGVIRGAVTSSN